ncbi:hypothetical protein JCM6882_006450 [Rhodosporidiobolus microsporus]
MTTVNLQQLKLQRVPDDNDEPEVDSDGEEWVDEDALREAQYFKEARYNIVQPNGRVLGYVNIWLVDLEAVEECGESFFMVMDEHSQEASDFAATVFTNRGEIKKRFSREGTGVCGREVTEGMTIAYLEMIRVEPEYRNKGVGGWALKALGTTRDEDLERISFLFSLPCSLHSEFPDPPDRGPGAVDPFAAEKEVMSKRVVHFFRRAGFRRVGTTPYLCCAYGPHPSQRIPIDQDADRVEDVDGPREPGTARLFEVIAQMHGRGGGWEDE